jgi:hypothetical protein
MSAFLVAALAIVGAAVAQPPDPRPGPLRERVRPTPISEDDIVERIMAFDKNKDGKVTKDELPERMHHLIDQGDTDKDGALDRDEVKRLVAARAAAPGGFGAGGFRVAGPGPGAPGGLGPRGGFAAGGFAVGDAARGFGPGTSNIGAVVDDLKLSGPKKEQALAAVKAHEESVRKLLDQARAELLQKLKEVLSDEEFTDFKAALDRPRGGTNVITVGPRDASREGGQQRPDPSQR